MKYCLSYENKGCLKEADEIKIPYYASNRVLEFIDQYPDKTIVLDIATIESIDWKMIKEFNILAKGNFVVCVYDLINATKSKENGVKFYFGFVATTWYDLNNYVSLGASYARLGSPLIHMLDKVKETYPDLKIRAVPNTAMTGVIRKGNGVTGDWIRPEDVEFYSQYIYVMEFEHCLHNPKKESIYFRVYSDGEWSGDLDVIIPDLNYKCLNRMIPPNTTTRRAVCRQQCQEPNNFCKLCYTIMDLSNKEKLEDYSEEFNLRS